MLPLSRRQDRLRTPSPGPFPCPVIDCSPYVPIYDRAKPEQTLEKGYTPPSRKVVQALKWPLKVYTATQRGFFSETEANTHLEPILDDLLTQGLAGKKNRIARKADDVYISNILRHVRCRASPTSSHRSLSQVRETGCKLRHHLIKEARIVIRTQYELVDRRPPNLPENEDQRGVRVREMLQDYRFAGSDPIAVSLSVVETQY